MSTPMGYGIPSPNEDDAGVVSVTGEVEVKNDTGNTVPVIDQALIDLGIPLGDIDPLNTKTSLGANETWVGDWQEFSPHPGILTFVIFDSPLQTVQIQWSADGVNHDTSVLGTTPLPIQAPISPSPYYAATYVSNVPVNKYYRLRIVNGASASTSGGARMWRLRAPYGGNYATLSSVPNAFSVALLTKAVGAGTTFAGEFGTEALAEHSYDAANTLTTPLTNGAITAFTVDTGTDEIISVAHGLANGDAVVLTTTGVLPAPLDDTTGVGTTLAEVAYWVINPSADRFQLTTNINATAPTAVNITDAGTGTHSYQKRGQFVGTFKDYSQVGHGLDFFFDVQKPALLQTEWSIDGTTVGTGVGALFNVSARSLTLTDSILGDLYVGVAIVQTMISKYRRVRIVNGPADQTTGLFSLTTFIGRENYPGSFSGLDTALTNLSTALLTRAVVAAQRKDGTIGNIRLSPTDAMEVRDERAYVTQSGSTFVEGILDHVSLVFSRDKQAETLTHLVDRSAGGGGTVTLDPVEGRVSFETLATPGSVCYYESDKTLRYDHAAHMLRFEQTIEAVLTNFVGTAGDAVIDWGAGESDGAGNLYNGIHWRIRVAGGVPSLFVCRTDHGTLSSEVAQADFNRDTLDGSLRSLFRAAGVPVAIDLTANYQYLGSFEWLGVAPPNYGIQTPGGEIIEAHIEEVAVRHSTTIPEPNVPLFIRIQNDSISGGVVEVYTGSWRGGTFSNKSVQVGLTPDLDYTDVATQGLHSANSTAVPLDGGGIFRGEWIEWQNNYVKMLVNLESDVSGTLYLDFSEHVAPVNGDESSVQDSLPIPYNPVTTSLLHRQTPVESRWVRTRYVNGPTAQSRLALDVAFTVTDPGLVTQALSAQPRTNDQAGVVRAVIGVGDGGGLLYHDVPVNPEGVPRSVISGFEAAVELEPQTGLQTRQIVLSAEPQRIDLPVLAGRKMVKVVNAGLFHAFIKEDSSITELNSEPLFLGGNGLWALKDTEELWGICEDTGGAAQNTSVSGTLAGGTATSPSNALLSDNTRALINPFATTLTVTGFSFALSPGFTTIERLRIGVEAQKAPTPATETVAYVGVTTGTGNTGSTVAAAVPAGTDTLYVAIMSRDNTASTVTGVTGLGLTWQAAGSGAVGTDSRTSMWYAYGSPALADDVTASYSLTGNSSIAVLRFTGADPTTPLEGYEGITGVSSSYSDSLVGTALGMTVVGVGMGNTTHTVGSGATERSQVGFGTGSNRVNLATTTEDNSTTTETYAGTFGGSTGWSVVAASVVPRNTISPVATVSYEYNAAPGATTGQLTWVNTSDATQFVDITSDFTSITPATIALIKAIKTWNSGGAAAIEVDHLFLEVRESSGAITRVSVSQIGETA